jgi:peptide/nickel transport system ATP-binding protein
VLEVQGLHVEFRRRGEAAVHAVNGVDLSIARGEILGLVGETGCGKTVTSLAILGLIRPPGRISQGRILLDGTDLRGLGREELRALRGSRIGYVPQNPRTALNPLLQVERQMRNVLASHRNGDRKGRGVDRSRCRELLEDVGIPDPDRVLRAYPHQLSGGMAQRVVIAIAMLLGPELVIADEPTTGLDVTVQLQILDLFSAAVRRDDAGVLLVTHDLGVVANYCHRVAVMYAGRVVETGPVREVFKRPRHPYTVGLLRSVPVVGEPLHSMPGQPPSLRSLPAGCAFADRCSHAQPHHRVEPPPWRRVSETHAFLCHLTEGAPLP